MKYRDVYDTTLEEGDCLYIPANFWYQSETVVKDGQKDHEAETIFTTFEYMAVSELMDSMVTAIDRGVLED
jgi:ribosomal protein L16 Arg81 hydroxylase